MQVIKALVVMRKNFRLCVKLEVHVPADRPCIEWLTGDLLTIRTLLFTLEIEPAQVDCLKCRILREGQVEQRVWIVNQLLC